MNLQNVSNETRTMVKAGEQALAAIDEALTVHQWLIVGDSLIELQRAAMHHGGTNVPKGRNYSIAWKELTKDAPKVRALDKATRSHAVWVAEHRAEVEKWYEELTVKERRLWRHPSTLFRKLQAPKPQAELTYERWTEAMARVWERGEVAWQTDWSPRLNGAMN